MAKPRPKSKSEETTPGTPVGPTVRSAGDADPAITAFTQGLEAFHRQDWSKAAELFETALAESDRLDLTSVDPPDGGATATRFVMAGSFAGPSAEGTLRANLNALGCGTGELRWTAAPAAR